jgi:hypothetical protein
MLRFLKIYFSSFGDPEAAKWLCVPSELLTVPVVGAISYTRQAYKLKVL